MFTKQDNLEKELQMAESETISAIIDQTMSITGEISFKGKTRIDGTINGDIEGEHLVLSETGNITGDINVTSFVCHGSITGNIRANLVNARKGCYIHGSLEAVSLSVEPGAAIDGEVRAASKEKGKLVTQTPEEDSHHGSTSND